MTREGEGGKRDGEEEGGRKRKEEGRGTRKEERGWGKDGGGETENGLTSNPVIFRGRKMKKKKKTVVIVKK